jgi:hypothetical protein
MKKSRLLSAVVLAVSLLSAAPWTAGIALAYGDCTGQLSPLHFDGALDKEGDYGDAGNMDTGAASLCTNDNDTENHIEAWTAIYSSSDTNYFAEAGYRRTKNVDYWLAFAEYEKSDKSGYVESSFGTELSNGTYIITDVQEYHSSEAAMEMTSNGSHLTTTYDPDGTWPGPWYTEWKGAVEDAQDQMPGTSTSPVDFGGLAVQPSSEYESGGFQDPSSYTLSADQGCYYKDDSDDFHIYHADSC